MLKGAMPAINDTEEDTVPAGLPFIVDAHVHIFPDPIFKAVRQWFDRFAWPIRYRFESAAVVDYLLSRGVGHIVLLQYAHKPGMARELNRYMSGICRRFPGRVTGLATVFPGEAQSSAILTEAFKSGLAGVKLHAHVQCFDMLDPAMEAIYQHCADLGRPLVMHASREPKSPAYDCDPYRLCRADKVETVISNFPGLKLCVPHLGVDEFRSYGELIAKYDNLWMDTAMVLTDYFPIANPLPLKHLRPDRIMYGSDFPNIPYAWDRELKWLARARLSADHLAHLAGRNAQDFFNIKRDPE